jgi:hypothetical protein
MDIFHRLDTDGDGSLTLDEFKHALATDDKVAKLLSQRPPTTPTRTTKKSSAERTPASPAPGEEDPFNDDPKAKMMAEIKNARVSRLFTSST